MKRDICVATFAFLVCSSLLLSGSLTDGDSSTGINDVHILVMYNAKELICSSADPSAIDATPRLYDACLFIHE